MSYQTLLPSLGKRRKLLGDRYFRWMSTQIDNIEDVDIQITRIVVHGRDKFSGALRRVP